MPLYHKKRLIISSVIAIIVIVVAVALYFFVYQAAPDSDRVGSSDTTQAIEQQLSDENEALRSESVSLLQSDGPAASQDRLNKALAESTNVKDKSYIYGLKVAIATSSQNPDFAAALVYAYEAEKLDPTFETALTIAELEHEINHKNEAITYYKLYLERSVAADGTLLDAAGRTFYENKLQALQS